MKLNAGAAASAIDRPSPDIRLYLLIGNDEAGIAELGKRLGRALGPEAERIDLEPATLRSDPARLADEAASIGLFGGARWIRVTGAGDDGIAAFEGLLAAERAGNPVVALAPGMKATTKLYKLAAGAKNAIASAVYQPDGRDAERLVVGIAREHGLRCTGATAQRLSAAAAGDRAVLASEIEKIALYLDAAPDRPRELDEAAIDAIGADLGEGEIKRVIEAAIGGDTAAIGLELARLDQGGISVIPLLRQLVKRLASLAQMRAEIDAGGGIDEVIKRHRVFFREEAWTARVLRRWSPAAFARAIDQARRAERQVMRSGTVGEVAATHAIAAITAGARRG